MPNKNLVLYLVKRYLRFDKEQPFIFLSALLAFLGIALGVMVLMIAMSLMNGFDKEFQRKLFVMNYPLTIIPKFYGTVDKTLLQSLEAEFSDLKFSPYITSQVIVRNGQKMEGGILFGVDAQKEKAINEVFAIAMGDKSLNKYDALIGQKLYEELFVFDKKKLTYIFTNLDPSGISLSPKMKRLNVIGTFESGLNAYDKAYNYTTIEAMQRILNYEKGLYDGIHVYSEKPMEDIKRLEAFLNKKVSVVGWWEQNGNFFAALELEKRAMFIVLMLMILIASVNIISSLLMTVMNRRSEIALLLSLGASTKEVKQTFLSLGVIIGIAGIIVGILLGFFGMWVLDNFDLISLPADVYGTSKLPLELSSFDFFSIIIGAFIITIISSLYPAKKASEVNILSVLRNE